MIPRKAPTQYCAKSMWWAYIWHMAIPTTDYSKLSTRELYELTAKAEGYESVPVDIDTFLNDPYYLGQTYDNGKAVYSYWRDALHKIYPNPLYSPYEEVCLSGDTAVDLLDGSRMTMAEICAMGPNAVFWVLAFNVNTKKWEPCKAGAACMTGIKPVYKITLDNGESFKATGNHKILGKDNRWYRADALKVGQSLMPYNLTYDDQGYAYVWDNAEQKSVKRARAVQRWKNGIPVRWHTHHKNQIRHDDRPDNIIALHRVVAIEILPPEPVYNFTVDRLHNYPLSCGVISSNCVTGCIGAGKTSFAIMGAMYDLYHVCLLREPQRKYKLLRTTRILFSLVTATKDLASAVMANQMLDVIAASPFFTSRFMPKKGEKLDEDMFPHHVGVGFGSRGGHNLGKAVIGAIIDEANFQEAVANQAVKNYETITRRMSSRFKLKNGSLPCRRWLVSSRNSDSSFLESHIEAVKNNPKVLVLAPAIWDVQKEKGIYSGKTFPVFIGTNTQQPMICTTEKEVEDHAGYIIEVPDIYKEEFEENLPGSLMDLAGVANRSSMSLIYNVEKWVACQCLDNAISKDEITLSIDGADKIMDYMVKDLPKYNYYVHLDGALKGDRFGFAMSAIEKQMTVSGRNLLSGEQTLRLSPALITPIAFGIKARPGSEVPLWKVRQFLLDLRNKGVCIMQVSTDGFQSADMRQMLEKMGFNVKYVSVDTTKDPYLKFASNINHGLMKVPKSPILDFEVRHLENRDKKVDHPDKVMVNGRYVKGSKDIADAVSASQHEALLASLSLSAGTLVEQLGETQHLSIRGRQEYVQDLIFGMAQGDPDKHIAGGLY